MRPAIGEFVDLLRVKRQRVEERLQLEQYIGRKEQVKNGTGQGQEHGEKSRQRTEKGGGTVPRVAEVQVHHHANKKEGE